MLKLTNRIATPAVGVVALAVAFAPSAGADQDPATCVSTGPNSTLCQTNGSARLHVRPPSVSSPVIYPFDADGNTLLDD